LSEQKFIKTLILCSILTVGAVAQDSGGLTGRVIDDVTGNPLQGASVTIAGSALNAQTDRTGSFRLLRVPSGPQSLIISYLGYETVTKSVEIEPGSISSIEANLKTSIAVSVDVSAPILEGQAKALNQQKEAVNITNIVSADQIGRFPDPNAAEATQRIPGITIERDQGEGRYVQVRGTEARLNSMMLDGERVPSPEGDVRAVALDVIPADLLEAIEVTKAPTADMDGDSIGGSVNLVTKGAPSKTRLSLTAGLGYNRIADDYLQTFNGTIGTRFFGNKLGILFAGSYLNTDRGSEGFEVAYDDGDLDELELRDYTVNRKRWGLNPTIDYRFSDSSKIFFKGIYNQFDDQEYRRRTRYRISDDRIERELKDRFEGQTITQASFGGEHLLPNFMQIDYKVSYAYADEEEPNRLDTTFRQKKVKFAPNVTPNSIDPNNIQANPLNEDLAAYTFDDAVRESNLTNERNFNMHFNASMPFPTSSGFAGILKFGVKNKFKKKFRDNNATIFGYDDSSDAPLFTQALDSNFVLGTFLNGLYDQGSEFVSPSIARQIPGNPLSENEIDYEGDAADYRARENVFAAFVQTNLNFGENFQLVPGVRYERTDVKYTGTEILFDDNGDFLARRDIPGKNTFNNFLASIHAKYRITDKSNFRVAFTQTLARPNFRDLTPFQLILEEDLELERGNPLLVPTTSNNFDILAEHYLSSVGIVSGGFFYKRLKNYIFPFTFKEDRPVGGPNGPIETFDIIQPLNGESASLYGIELAFQNRFSFLPGPLDGFGVYANYTYVNSNAILPNEDFGSAGRKSILPGQAKNIANFALSYEKYGFSGRASWHLRDKYLSEVASDAAKDIFVDRHLQLDVNLSQKITKNFRVFAEFINLTNEPFKRYEGVSTRPVQVEYYRWWATFGIKYDW
ncbi:MAG: TonB-dependent receptor, partial [Acidobacteria bacterium]|nr:TonB-dependent receptor [Acidobacteriota bacterium]